MSQIFCFPKTHKIEDRLCMKFSSTPNTNVQRCLNHIFQNQQILLFYLSFFSKDFLNPQVRINKIIKKYSVDYRPFLTELTSRTHSLIFLQSFYGFLSPESLLNFVLNLYVPPCLGNIFNFMVSRLQI